MSISKKVFWIFLSIVMMVVMLGITMHIYQNNSSRMHKVLHALLDFNESVFELREAQIRTAGDSKRADSFELQRKASELKTAMNRLSGELTGFLRTDINFKVLSSDIDNYLLAVNEYSTHLKRSKALSSELTSLSERLNSIINRSGSEPGFVYADAELSMKEFLETNSPASLRKIKHFFNEYFKTDNNGGYADIVKRQELLLDSIYLTKLNMAQSSEFLNLSAEKFNSVVSKISSELRKRDNRLDNYQSFASTGISVFSIFLALFYWIFINRYFKRFLHNQSAVMESIRDREAKKELKPFSKDELGELTQRMWTMAGELYEKDDELRRSEEKYRTYISSTPIAVVVFDVSRNIIEVNAGAEKFFGYTASELHGMKFDELISGNSRTGSTEMFSLMSETVRQTILLKMVNKENKLIYANVSCSQISNGRFVAFCQDISKRVQLEKEMKKINDNLKEQVKEEVEKNLKQDQIIQQQKKLADMGMMVSAIAHQWRQPLNALALCVQDVKEEYTDGALSDEYLEIFEANTMKLIMHMSKTIDDFRDFFAPDKTRTDFNLVQELSELSKLINVQLASKNIQLTIRCTCKNTTAECSDENGLIDCSDEEAVVHGYPGEMKQVLINLIYNSADSIQDKKEDDPYFRGVIDISVICFPEKVRVIVYDNGKGIPADTAPHIFEPYFTTKPDGKGTGIGLYMSKVIIENHMNGKLSMKEVHEGACFELELPSFRTLL